MYKQSWIISENNLYLPFYSGAIFKLSNDELYIKMQEIIPSIKPFSAHVTYSMLFVQFFILWERTSHKNSIQNKLCDTVAGSNNLSDCMLQLFQDWKM